MPAPARTNNNLVTTIPPGTIPDLLSRTTAAPQQNADGCIQCKKKFGLFLWRHHCRCCGGSACSTCCFTTVRGIPGYPHTQERACGICLSNQFLHIVVWHQGVFAGFKERCYMDRETATSVYQNIDTSCSRVIMHAGSGRVLSSWFARQSWEEKVMGRAFQFRETVLKPQPSLPWIVDLPLGGARREQPATTTTASPSAAAATTITAPRQTSSSSWDQQAQVGTTEWYTVCVVWRRSNENLLSHAFTTPQGEVEDIKAAAGNTAFIAVCRDVRSPSTSISSIAGQTDARMVGSHVSTSFRVAIIVIHRRQKEVSGLFTYRYALADSLSAAFVTYDGVSGFNQASSFGEIIRDGKPLPASAVSCGSSENENSDEWCIQLVDISTCDVIAAKGSRKGSDPNLSSNVFYAISSAFRSKLSPINHSAIHIACTILADEVIGSHEGWTAFIVGIPTYQEEIPNEQNNNVRGRGGLSGGGSGGRGGGDAGAVGPPPVAYRTVESHCKLYSSASIARKGFFGRRGCVYILPEGEASEPFLFRRHPGCPDNELRRLTTLASQEATKFRLDTASQGGGHHPQSAFNNAAASSSSPSTYNNAPPPATSTASDRPLWATTGSSYVSPSNNPQPTAIANASPLSQPTTSAPLAVSSPTTPAATATTSTTTGPSKPSVPECQICMDVFNCSTRKPCLCGNCGNSLCLECIESCSTCPFCREDMPDFTARRPMTNVQLLQLVQEIEDQN